MPHLRVQTEGLFARTHGSGPLHLLLVHGWLCSSRYWEPMMAQLPSDRYTAHALDLRGFAESSAVGPPYDLDQHASDVLEVSRTLAPSGAILVGNSAGGLICLLAALRRPQAVRALVLISTAPGGCAPSVPMPSRQSEERLRKLFERARAGPARSRLWERLIRGPLPETLDPETGALLVRDGLRARPAAAEALLIQSQEADVEDRLGAVSVPVLVLAGNRDPWARGLGPWHEALPQAQVCVLEGLGHFPMLEAPARVAGVIESFLHRHGLVVSPSRSPRRATGSSDVLEVTP